MHYKKIARACSVLSFLYLLGIAGNSDAGLEPDLASMCTKLLIGIAVFAFSSWKGGLLK